MITLRHENLTHVVGTIDWGYTNPTACQVHAMDKDGRLFVVWEFYQTQVLITELIPILKEATAHFRVEFWIADPSEPAYIKQCRTAGLRMREANNDVAPGIQAVQARLRKAGDGKPRLFIFRDALVSRDERIVDAHKPCGLVEEFDGYVWQKTVDGKPNKEEPVKDGDHSLDALRYLVMHFDAKAKGKIISWS